MDKVYFNETEIIPESLIFNESESHQESFNVPHATDNHLAVKQSWYRPIDAPVCSRTYRKTFRQTICVLNLAWIFN